MYFESGLLSLEGWGKLERNVGEIIPWVCVCKSFSQILVLSELTRSWAIHLPQELQHCTQSLFSGDAVPLQALIGTISSHQCC